MTNPNPTLWRNMTPTEKGALLLANHEGKAIELWHQRLGWVRSFEFGAVEDIAYRVKPEPTVETVEVNGHVNDWKQFVTDSEVVTHRITFDIIDGQPDPASIRMESL